MITVLRIDGEPSRLREYVIGINRLSVAAKAHLDRSGRVVADLSRNKTDWGAHIGEVASAITVMRSILRSVHDAGDRAIVDTGVYARTEFVEGVAVSTDSYHFPPSVLRQFVDLSLGFEITVRSISPD